MRELQRRDELHHLLSISIMFGQLTLIHYIFKRLHKKYTLIVLETKHLTFGNY